MRAPDDFYFVCNSDKDAIVYHAVVDPTNTERYNIYWTRPNGTSDHINDTREYLENGLLQTENPQRAWRIISIDTEPESEFEIANIDAIL